ncbi:putative DNA-directed RNA polymerase [Medicago truncatula]|uniref:Putative DNA-directed RNA polymerase n=1 Tax=Medicago truncatula TaxID=3880 RepID=A0A396I4L8_MEDTR|nr:putative DNA-directed RNA polymerase [Medicago truncatula]
MIREKVKVSARTLQWKCVESRVDSKRLYYGRFILSPLRKGQADTIGIAMRRILLGEIEGTCITRAKSEKIPHEYSTIVEIVLKSNLYGTRDASICFKGPGYVTAQDIILPPSVEIRGYRIKTLNNIQDGSYTIDAVFMPVRNANHSIHSYVNGNEKQEILFLEIWTNGSLTPKEALYEASRNLIDLFIPFLHAEEENLNFENNQHKVTLPLFTFHDRLLKDKLRKNKKEIALKSIFIDQLELSPRIYNCLKKSNIHTLLELLNKSQEDLMKIEHFRVEDVKNILNILQIEKHFA